MHHSSTACNMAGCLWIQQLSIMRTELGKGQGCMRSRSRFMKWKKRGVSNEPSTMLTWRILSFNDSAGSTENLLSTLRGVSDVYKKTIPSSTAKKCFTRGLVSFQWPRTTSIRGLAVHQALVHKDKLFWAIWTNSSTKLSMVTSIPLQRNTCQLWKMSHYIPSEIIIFLPSSW